MSDSLQPHESQNARPPCPSPTPGVPPNPHPSSRWCHPAISSSVVPFSSYLQSLPASESFPVSQLFTHTHTHTHTHTCARAHTRQPTSRVQRSVNVHDGGCWVCRGRVRNKGKVSPRCGGICLQCLQGWANHLKPLWFSPDSCLSSQPGSSSSEFIPVGGIPSRPLSLPLMPLILI